MLQMLQDLGASYMHISRHVSIPGIHIPATDSGHDGAPPAPHMKGNWAEM